EFWEYVRGLLAARYEKIDSIPVVINGDEASWIREGAQAFKNGFYQIDRFHISRTITEALRGDKEHLREAQKALAKDDMARLLITVTEACQKAKDPEARERLKQLRETLVDQHEYIRDYRQRLREAGFKV
ncbi:UPF0236 family transposase-like protein, partial [Calderihabitans maritimus]